MTWHKGLVMGFLLSVFVLLVSPAKAHDMESCAQMVEAFSYERDLLLKLTGERPVRIEGNEVVIADRSRSFLKTDIGLARRLITDEIARLGFTSRQIHVPVSLDPALYLPPGDFFADAASLGLAQQVSQLLSRHADELQRLIPNEMAYENIVVDSLSSNPNAKWIYVLAHYDSVNAVGNYTASRLVSEKQARKIHVGSQYWASPGADDNASGVVVLLSLLKKLATRSITLDHHLRFVFLDGEELSPLFRQALISPKMSGRKGSQYLVSQLSKEDRKAIEVVMNFDTVGSQYTTAYSAAPSHLEYTRAGAEVVKQIQESVLPFDFHRYNNSVHSRQTDAAPFVDAKIPVVSFSSLAHYGDPPPHVNGPTDTSEVINWETYGKFLEFAWDLLRGVGGQQQAP